MSTKYTSQSQNAKGHVYLNGEDSSVDDVSSSCHGGDATFTENKSVKIAKSTKRYNVWSKWTKVKSKFGNCT